MLFALLGFSSSEKHKARIKRALCGVHIERILVRLSGLEPPTPTMSRWCSNQLSYRRIRFF